MNPATGGIFDWVTELARSPLSKERPLDLGLRADPRRPGRGSATLYVGTTQVLTVSLHADDTYSLSSWKPDGLFKNVAPPLGDGWSPSPVNLAVANGDRCRQDAGRGRDRRSTDRPNT